MHLLVEMVSIATQAEETQNSSAVELTLHVLATEVAIQAEETQIKSAVELTLNVLAAEVASNTG